MATLAAAPTTEYVIKDIALAPFGRDEIMIAETEMPGLMALRADLRTRAQTHAQLFTPPAIIDRLIAQGQRLSDLNRG